MSVINRRAVVLVEVCQEPLAKGCRQPIAQLMAMYCSLSKFSLKEIMIMIVENENNN